MRRKGAVNEVGQRWERRVDEIEEAADVHPGLRKTSARIILDPYNYKSLTIALKKLIPDL